MLDYGSWVSTLSRDDVIDIATKHLDQPFEAAFEDVFGSAPPDELNGDLSLTIVATELDASSERIVNYLRGFGVPVNAVFFSYLEDDGRRYLARSWLAAPTRRRRPPATARRRASAPPWNGLDWYVNFGTHGRDWDDARGSASSPPAVGGFFSDHAHIPVGAGSTSTCRGVVTWRVGVTLADASGSRPRGPA